MYRQKSYHTVITVLRFIDPAVSILMCVVQKAEVSGSVIDIRLDYTRMLPVPFLNLPKSNRNVIRVYIHLVR